MKAFLISLKLLLFFTLLTGIIYPFFVTSVAQIFISKKANGSIIIEDSVAIGSVLIGQIFDSSIYFMSRPSAILYNTLPSGGSNLGLTNSKLGKHMKDRKQHFISFNNLDSAIDVPSGMIFASASGLDPHISPDAAFLQVNRIVQARKFNNQQRYKLEFLIEKHIEYPQYLCLGEKRVNVLLLNLETDKIK